MPIAKNIRRHYVAAGMRRQGRVKWGGRFKKRNKNKPEIVHTRQAFPDEIVTTLSYVDEKHLASSTFGDWVFKANSLYDPDFSVILNPQPYYYDQLSAVYANYEVLSSHVTLEIVNQSTTDNVYLVSTFTNQNPVGLLYAQLQETPYAKTRVIGPSVGKGITTWGHGISYTKLIGQKDIKQKDDQIGKLGGLGIGTDPADLIYFCLAAFSVDGLTNLNLYCRARWKFKVRVFNREISALSLGAGMTGATGPYVVSTGDTGGSMLQLR